MNKYTYLLFLSACMITQGVSATVNLDITIDGQTQTIQLEQDQSEICVFENTRIIIRNKEEHVDSTCLEIAAERAGEIIVMAEMNAEFDKHSTLNFENQDQNKVEMFAIDILATK